MDDSACQFGRLHHPGGEGGYLPVALVAQPDVFQHLVGSLHRHLRVHPDQFTAVADLVDRLESGGQAVVFRHVTDALANQVSLRPDIVSEHLSVARCDLDQAEQRLDEGALASPVRTEQSGRTRLDVDADRIQGDMRTVVLRQLVRLDDDLIAHAYASGPTGWRRDSAEQPSIIPRLARSRECC